MNTEQLRDYVHRYLEATECQIIERHPTYVTVRLSPEADKALMNRPYYWSFVERTGAEPETVSLTFVFDEEQYNQMNDQRSRSPSNTTAISSTSAPIRAGQDSILARYFGTSPSLTQHRTRHETITFGCGRLNQIFRSAKDKGAFIHLYEQPDEMTRQPGRPAAYISYLAVNYKIEYMCDMKRDELLSLGICLTTGEVLEHFYERTKNLRLSPKLPAHTHINDMLSLPRAVAELEQYLERYVKSQDHGWASQAEQRMYDELDRIKHYYQEMIQNSNEDEDRLNMQREYHARQDEIAWQYKPRVLVSVVNCGIFHLMTRL